MIENNITSRIVVVNDGFYWNISAQKKRTGDYKDGWGRKIVDKLDATNNTYENMGNVLMIMQSCL